MPRQRMSQISAQRVRPRQVRPAFLAINANGWIIPEMKPGPPFPSRRKCSCEIGPFGRITAWTQDLRDIQWGGGPRAVAPRQARAPELVERARGPTPATRWRSQL